jgi:ABC-type polysaccharide/polyol phosphate transport system ATPase subunit
MSDIAIRAKNLGKLYQISQRENYQTLRETLAAAISNPFQGFTSALNGDQVSQSKPESSPRISRSEGIWALRDTSFEIKKGETVGIIGPNGSGKSTLLKLLAQITEPTEGEIYLNGRVSALIELSAGFHPELTGRENIYLNGAILGLSKKEVDAKFDAITDFAELWDFLDTPVKHYSSGMTVRLGFSLAVSVDPEILLVDEVLAVGDAAFRRRCFERIDAFIRAGKTIVVVTHNLHEIQRIARRVILIYKGLLLADEAPDLVIGRYASLVREANKARIHIADDPSQNVGRGPVIEITSVGLYGAAGDERFYFKTHDELNIRVNYFAHQRVVNPVIRVQIYRSDGIFCHGMNTARHGLETGELSGAGSINLRYPSLSLLEGDYSIRVAILSDPYDELPLHQFTESLCIRVDSDPIDGGGVVAMATEWTTGCCVKGDLGNTNRG